jgi:anoctamin-10/anoctamin-7
LCAITNGIYIKISNLIFEVIANKINNLENWETESEYEINLIVKLILFKFINSYSSLFYIAFIRKFFERCVNDDCIMELSV